MIASTISDGAWGNLLVGGIVGVMVDQSSGAAYRYYDPPRLALIAAGETPPESSRLLAKGVTLLPPSTGPTPPSPPPEPAFETATAPSSTVAAPARPAGTPPAAGVWECGLKSGSRHYKLQFVVAANHSMVVTSYANAPATVVNNEPLTLTALNPRGDRPMNIVWNTDNTMVITGPSSTAPSGSFHNEGTCAKM